MKFAPQGVGKGMNMGFSQRLSMKQGQSLVMTPQLSQSIKLLALSNIELAAFVEEEIERNPFLERDRRTDGQAEDARSQEVGNNDGKSPETLEAVTGHQELETSVRSLSENLGTSLENVYPDEQDYRSTTNNDAKTEQTRETRIASGGLQVAGGASAHDQSIADYTASHENLRDHLLGQLAISGASRQLSLIASDIIENLDDAGYLRTELDSIAERLGCLSDQTEQALALLQSFEPIGVGARDLTECLRLQLQDRNRLDPAMAEVIANLDLLAKRDFAALQKLTGLDIEDLHDVLMEIQALDPKPGTAFESTPVQHVVPDVFVREQPDGSWAIELNSETLPRVLVNNTYVAEIGGKLHNGADKEFMTDCMQTANWLTKSLDQRAHTILKVSKEIVKQQDAFLVHGVRHLRPLTLRAVADDAHREPGMRLVV